MYRQVTRQGSAYDVVSEVVHGALAGDNGLHTASYVSAVCLSACISMPGYSPSNTRPAMAQHDTHAMQYWKRSSQA